MRRRWPWLLVVAVALALLGGIGYGLEVRRFRGELAEARRAIDRRELGPARSRLEALAIRRPGWGGGEVDYWLGVCRWGAGQREAALEAFRRVPSESEYAARAAVFEAEILLTRWGFREAEDRLLPLLRDDRADPKPVRAMLIKLYRMEARFDEVRRLLRASLAEADDPIPILSELWTLDRGTVPTEGLRANLEPGLKAAPDDDRVWLGMGRVETLDGHFEAAEGWLRRCLQRRADPAVWRAWLEWARASGRDEEVVRALSELGESEFDRAERLEWRAWLLQRRSDDAGEREVLGHWLEMEPNQPRALDRLAALAATAGEPDRAAELRRRKARVDEALDRYGRRMLAKGPFETAADRVEMARLAERGGRPFDSVAWCELAERLDPGNAEIADIRRRAERIVERLASRSDGPADGMIPKGDVHPSSGLETEPTPRVRFAEIASGAGISFVFENGESRIRQMPETMSGGVGLLDYDGDGWLDVYVVQGGPFPPESPARPSADRLFHNRGDGTFEDATERAGLSKFPGGYGHGVAVGDFDNDGHPDLFVTRWRAYALYRNKGDGTFEDATESAGLSGDRDWPTSAAFADLDDDGDLDLYVCHYLRWDADHPRICRGTKDEFIYCSPRDFESMPDHLFRNEGGRFVDVTAEAGIVDRDGRGLGVVAADLDGDSEIDLYVANDMTANFLFRNLGGMRFEEIGHEAGAASSADGSYQASMGIACGDLDGDGRIDLAVTNFYGESTTFYRNLGHGSFDDRTAAVGLKAPSRHLLGFGASVLDADNDGHLDLLTANGHLHPLPDTPHKMPLQLLLGTDRGTLSDATASAGPALTTPRLGRGLAVGDLDNDGRLDAVMVDQNRPLVVLRNESADPGHFLTLRLEGTASNRDAVGAVVTVVSGGRRLVAQRFGGGSYQSAGDPRLHFGLGRADLVDSVEVSWPSGRVDRYRGWKADMGYLLREGEAEARQLAGFERGGVK